MGIGLWLIFLYKVRLCEEDNFEIMGGILLILLGLKVVVWAGVQSDLF
jgi:hypothetical protein